MNWYSDESYNFGNRVIRKFNSKRYPKTMKGSLTLYKDNVYEAKKDITGFDPPGKNGDWELVLEKAGGSGVMALIVPKPLCTSDLLYFDGKDHVVLSCRPWNQEYRVFVARMTLLPNGWLRSKQQDDIFQDFREEFYGFFVEEAGTEWINLSEVQRDVNGGNKDFSNKIPCEHTWHRFNLPCFPVMSAVFCEVKGNSATCAVNITREFPDIDKLLVDQHKKNKRAWINACTGLLLKWWTMSSRTARYCIISLKLSDENVKDHALHANALLVDKQTMTCTRIESHGKNPLYDGRTDRAIRKFLKEQTMYKGKWIQYQSVQSRPEIPLFQIQYSNNLCASWALYAVLQALRIQIQKEREGKPVTILQSTRMAYGSVVTDPIRLVRFWAYYFGVAMQKGSKANWHSSATRMEGFLLQHLPKLAPDSKSIFKNFIENVLEFKNRFFVESFYKETPTCRIDGDDKR